MTELYFLKDWQMSSIDVLLGLTFVAQTIYLVLNYLRRRSVQKVLLPIFLEAVILEYIVYCLYEIAVVRQIQARGLILRPALGYFALLLLGKSLVLAGLYFWRKRSWRELLPLVPALCLLLPAQWPQRYLFTAVIVFYFFYRALWLTSDLLTVYRREITELSIKQNLDNLPDGILFYRQDGRVEVMNRTMRHLAQNILGFEPRNAKLFFAVLLNSAVPQGVEVEPIGENFLVHLNSKVYSFRRDLLSIDGEIYWQLLATDVTLWSQRRENLRRQNKLLQERQEDLKIQIENLEEIVKNRESINLRRRVHDVLGQKVAVILHAVQGDLSLEDDFIRSLAEDLKGDLYAKEEEPTAARQYEDMVELFANIDIDLQLKGSLPELERIAQVFVEIIREATNNAVRHALADEVYIECREDAENYYLTIRNNGQIIAKELNEGGGIRGMRQVIAELGGELEIDLQRGFELAIIIPRTIAY
ncbi:MAG: hypothetical protein Q4P65_02445 [Eubacteriales bacterium]|nr:hypothetical protein [Eubacteriales bacterium]